MAEIREVVSESLQATIRRLLPSQKGFTEDLQASNVITPIIDLTPTAEGSILDTDLARCFNFGDATALSINNTVNSVVASTGGFYRLAGFVNIRDDTSAYFDITLFDGTTSKTIMTLRNYGTGGVAHTVNEYIDHNFFIRPQDSLRVTAFGLTTYFEGSIRQIADVNGNITAPSGYTSE